MTIDISANNPRISYSVAAGVTQTSFAVPFEFFDDSDLNVYIDTTLQTITTNYTVTGGAGSTGTVTMSVTGPKTVILTRDTTIERTTDFTAGVDINRAALNTQLDTLTAISADNKDLGERSIRITDYDPAASNLLLPDASTRADKLLSFDTEGDIQVQSASDLLTGSVLGANYTKASYTGNGTQTAYSTVESAGSKNNIQVYVDGVYQNKDTFSISGFTLTFTEAPPLNSAIEFIVGNAVTSLTTDPAVVTYNQGGTGAQDRTLTSKLQEFLSVKDFGAVGDGVTDDSAAIQAAISAATYGVYFPEGNYVAAEIPLNKSDFVFYGPMAAITNNLAGAKHTFVVRDGINFRRSKVIFGQVTNQGTAGHIFSIENGGISGCTFDITELAQNTTSYKIMTNEVGGTTVGSDVINDNGTLFFSDIKGNQWSCSASNTADELIYICGSVNICSVNTFEISDIRPLGSGRFATFHSTSASGASFNQIKIKDAGVEKSNNGFVNFKGVHLASCENIVFYDMGVANPTIDASLIVFESGTNGTTSEGSAAVYIRRNGGALNTGIYDIECLNDQIYLENIGARTSGDGFTVNLGNNRVLVNSYQQTTFDNQSTTKVTLIDKSLGVVTPVANPHKLIIGDRSELTIASGAVTATGSFHGIDTEGDAATDDLDTINGGEDGMYLIIVAQNSARTVVAKDGTGNLRLNGDFSLDHQNDTLTLIHNGSNWLEVSRSDNQT